jgi:hypothetical protein
MRFDEATEYTRENTGSHFLDSGGASGRHWQQPAPARARCVSTDLPDLTEVDCLCGPSINLTAWLAECITEAEDFGASFHEWAAEREGSWFELVSAWMEGQGYTQAAGDNTYNSQNDFSQDFVYEVWQRPESGSEWLYDDDAIVVMFIHTGADIRGGYGRPLFSHASDNTSEHPFPLDWRVKVALSEEGTEDSDPLTEDNGDSPYWDDWYDFVRSCTRAGFEQGRIVIGSDGEPVARVVNPDTGHEVEVSFEWWAE